MIPVDFDYIRPNSLEEALSLLRTPGVIPLAGGQDLVPRLSDRHINPKRLVDISRLTELRKIHFTSHWLVVGGGVTLSSMMTPELAEAAPLLNIVLRSVGTIAVRNRATLAGNLVVAHPNSELPVALLALDARLVLRSSQGKRELGIEEFFLRQHKTALVEGELLVEVRIPFDRSGKRLGGFSEIAARSGALPLGCVAVSLSSNDNFIVSAARIVAGGIAGIPVRCRIHEAVVVGQPVHQITALLHKHIELDLQPCPQLPSSEYALDVAKILIRRAVALALAQHVNQSVEGATL